MSILTDRQRADLNKSILAYLQTSNISESILLQLSETLGVDGVLTDEEAIKVGSTLEKKWTTVVRLQRRVLDLESQVSALKLEVESSQTVGSSSKTQDPLSWLPRAPARVVLSGHRQPITALAFHPIFSSLASCSEDGIVKIWDWELGEIEKTIKAHTKSVLDIDYGGPDPACPLLASCSSDLTIKIWDPSADYANIRTLTGHDHTISSIKFTPNGTYLISASRDKTIRIWDVQSGYAIRTIRGHTDWIKSVAPSLDGEYILSAGIDQTARISSTHNGEGKLVFVGHDHVIECACFAPHQSYTHLAAIEGLRKPVSSQYSKSFEYIATCSRDKTIKLWNSRQEVIATLEGHDNWVRDLVFHPSGKYLISVSDDRTMRCWDLSQRGKCVRVINDAHNHFISCIAWVPPIQTTETSDISNSNNNSNNYHKNLISMNTHNGDPHQVQKRIRCVIATGSIDLDIKLWA